MNFASNGIQCVFSNNLGEILNIGQTEIPSNMEIWTVRHWIGQKVTNHAEISQVESLITDFQGWLFSKICYFP